MDGHLIGCDDVPSNVPRRMITSKVVLSFCSSSAFHPVQFTFFNRTALSLSINSISVSWKSTRGRC